jgi:hypothetical protein
MPEVAFRSDVAVFDIGQIFRFDLSLALEAAGFSDPPPTADVTTAIALFGFGPGAGIQPRG